MNRLLAPMLLVGLLVDCYGHAAAAKSEKSAPKETLVLFPPCPSYHAIGIGNGNTRIDADVNLPATQRTGARLVVEVLDAAGKTIQSANADASSKERVGVEVRIPNLATALFPVVVKLIDGSGKQLATGRTDVHVGPVEQATVTMDADGYLRAFGKQHFVIGMYQSGHLPEMARAGFSGTHNYQITTGEADETINPTDMRLKNMLDNSWSNGLRMMVELPRKAIEKGKWTQVARRIETFKYHPGVLCWGSEERVARNLTSLTNIAALNKLVHQIDANHVLVLGDTKDKIKNLQTDRRDFFPDPYMDAGIWWWYPIPLKDPDGNGLLEGREKTGGLLNPPAWLTTTWSKKPLWIAIQSYQHPSKDARFPTPAEYRCMAYLSIINGVKGLWFYTGSGQKDWQGKPSGIFNKPEEGHWDYVQKLVTELRQFSPVIMSPKSDVKFKMIPSDAPVEFTTRVHEGRLYIIAANKSGKEVKVRFTGAPGRSSKAGIQFEQASKTVDLEEGVVFEPFAVHVFGFPRRIF